MTTCLEKELFIPFTARAFLYTAVNLCIYVFFSFDFEGRIWDLILSVHDHCLSFYFIIIVIVCPFFCLSLSFCPLCLC